MKRKLLIFLLTIALVIVAFPMMGGEVYAASKPGKVVISSIKANSTTAFTLKWKKVSGAKGYQIRYSTKKSMSGAKAKLTTSKSKKITKLKAGTKYYVQVRAYKKNGSRKVYGKWSKKKKVTTHVPTTTVSDLSAYLKSTKNCQVGNSAIKSITNSLTAGLTTDVAKAKAIFNYVRDKIAYEEYKDTKYGAVETLNRKSGNCADQAHLLIAMLRTARIPARYCCGRCLFTDGRYTDHVWADCSFDGITWYVLDPTSLQNGFDSIKNWNTDSYVKTGVYNTLPF